MKHPFLPKMIDYFEANGRFYIIREMLWEFFSFVEHYGNMNEKQTAFFVAEIATALFELHKNGIPHFDIKLKNIYLDDHGHAILADIGFHIHAETEYVYFGDWCMVGKMILDMMGLDDRSQSRKREWMVICHT